MTVLSILLVGLLLGMKHATEADHLAAVATLATRQTSLAHAVRQGVAWGVGHTLTLMAFGGAVLLLGRVIPPAVEHALEVAVGVMLIALGLDLLRRLRRDRIHFHIHRHASGSAHVHAHSHRGEGEHAQSRHDHRHPAGRWPLRALVVGVMHGLAGSAALVVLSLGSAPSPSIGLAYIALFGVGSILGMTALSVALAWPLRISAGYLDRVRRRTTGVVGIFSCGLGAWIAWTSAMALR